MPFSTDGGCPLCCSEGGCSMVIVGCLDAGVARPPLPRSGRARSGSSAYAISDTTVTTTSATHDARTRTRGVRSTFTGPGRPNDVSRAARAGSVLARRCSISARMRCSSMESAMAPPPPVPAAPAQRRFWSNRCLTQGNSCSSLPRMRWDGIRVTGGTPGAPALFERDAVARTFDTPGFRGMTFFEVHARSVINRVPDASRLPFRWTINPYRGCSHACSYCVSGETPILMADGRTRPLADVRPGDAIYGTVRRGSYRRYVPTRVRAWWQTVKPAYLTTLEDGTSLVTSGDHRFLSDRGWKYVTGAMRGPLQRPYLTTGNKLMGVGAFADQPKDSVEYRRGYLCGMARGDGSLGVYSHRNSEIHQFRLALVDTDAL